MRTSTPRAPRRSQHIAVRTINLIDQVKPEAFVDSTYVMSTPQPLQDPCGYAAIISGPNNLGQPAQRILQNLAPTADETEAQIKDPKGETCSRSSAGNPLSKLASLHDIDSLKEQMNINGVKVADYEQHKQRRQQTSDYDRVAATPLRRVHEGPQGSVSKRQRTNFTPNTSVANASLLLNTTMDEDVSFDTVRSVLRLVDESLINTPERKAPLTPRVLRAQPVPSPRERGPAFAYNSRSQLDQFGGLAGRGVPLAPFGFSRV